MTADARYQQAIQSFQEEYSKSELVNLRSHCRKYNINYKSLLRWMYRHNITVLSLKQGCSLPIAIEEECKDSTSADFIQVKPRKVNTREIFSAHSSNSALKDISISFGDGITINLSSGSAEDIACLVSSYKQQMTLCSL